MDVRPRPVRASIIFHVLTLRCEVWRCHVKSIFGPASAEVLLQLGPMFVSRDQQ